MSCLRVLFVSIVALIVNKVKNKTEHIFWKLKKYAKFSCAEKWQNSTLGLVDLLSLKNGLKNGFVYSLFFVGLA